MCQPYDADRAEHPLTPDMQAPTPVGTVLTTSPAFASFLPIVHQRPSSRPTASILSTYPPTQCGFATFTASLACALEDEGVPVSIVRIADGSPSASPRVVGELDSGSAKSVAAASELLNRSDIAIIQHEYGLFGGMDGEEILDVIDGLRIPLIVVVHTVQRMPSTHQRSVLEAVAARADHLIVTSRAAADQLRGSYGVSPRQITVIPQGLTIPTGKAVVRGGRPTLLTCGLLRPGKGIERVIEAMGSLHTLPGQPRYVIAGPTDPKELAAHGEAYRERLKDHVCRMGLQRAVVFDDRPRGRAAVTGLLQTAAVVVLPYDSTDQVSSGMLVDAIAAGRPTVATAFPHAVEVMAHGTGTVVDHDDPEQLVSALFQVLTQPRLAGTMAAEARRLAQDLSWPAIGARYHTVVGSVLVQRSRRG